MKNIKNFVIKNQMAVVMVMVVAFFCSWIYTAHENMVARDAEREARIEQVIANGGAYYPSEDMVIGTSYVADR